MQGVVGLRAVVVGLGTVLMALVLGTAAAQASDVTTDFGTLRIEGDPDDDAITVSSDGTTLTIVDTGTGGATDNDTDCSQVNAQTVTCAIEAGTPEQVRAYSVSFDDGVDSFTNQNFAAEGGGVNAQGATGAKTVAGGPGNQFIFGGVDSDDLNGGDGDDTLFDGSGLVDGFSSGGNDNLVGGAGEDDAQYVRAGGVSVSLDGVANDGQPGETDNVQTENVSTGGGADTVVGDAGTNVLSGGGGADVVSGLAGNDDLFGDSGGNGGALRGGGIVTGDDTVIGGAGRDAVDCGRGFDQALRDPFDEVETNCERIGADVAGDSATVTGKKKNKVKVEIACPEAEGAPCTGKFKISAGSKKIGKGTFVVDAGASKPSGGKLSKKGRKALKRAGGSLLVTVLAQTTEPGGISESSGRILIHD